MGQVKLRLLRTEEQIPEVVQKEELKPKFKSSMAAQMNSFADDLDKQIAALLAD